MAKNRKTFDNTKKSAGRKPRSLKRLKKKTGNAKKKKQVSNPTISKKKIKKITAKKIAKKTAKKTVKRVLCKSVSKPPLVMEVNKICQDIKNLHVQGARNVAIMGLSALVIQGLSLKTDDAKVMIKSLESVKNYISLLRPTEPMLFNFFDVLFVEIKKCKDVKSIKETLYFSHKKIEQNMREHKIQISGHATKLIKNGDVILTHCHSSTVVESLIYAKTQGKKFKVYACETRPRWQGHKTVRRLASAGVDVTLMPDGGIATVMDDYKVKKVMVGADAVDGKGNFANKVGSRSIAICAKEYKIPLYVLTELYKYDKRPKIIIEHRDPSEVANPKHFKGVNILNLAFEIVPAKYVNSFITEKGKIKPAKFAGSAKNIIKHLLN